MSKVRVPGDAGVGDDGFDAFYRDQVDHVRRFARALVRPEDVDDIVSLTFATAWTKFDLIRPQSARSWLFGICLNMARNHWRSQRRYRSMVDVIATQRLPSDDDDLKEVADSTELDTLAGLLHLVSPADRELLIMVGWLGMTPTEIALARGVTAGSIRVRLHRLRRLANRLPAEPLDQVPDPQRHGPVKQINKMEGSI